MATYVTSGIHGDIKAFEEILDKIGLCDKDTLYILGNVVDGGKHGIDILKRILDSHNMKLTIGDHEYMMMDCLGFPWNGEDTGSIYPTNTEKQVEWMSLGGRATKDAWNRLDDVWKSRIRDFLLDCPLEYEVHLIPDEELKITAPEFTGGFLERQRQLFRWQDEKRGKRWYAEDGRYYLLSYAMAETTYDHLISDDKDSLAISGRLGIKGYFCTHTIDDSPVFGNGDYKCKAIYGTSQLLQTDRILCLRLDDMQEYFAYEEPELKAKVKPKPGVNTKIIKLSDYRR